MRLEFFIARKLLKKDGVDSKKRHNFSKPIVNLAIIGVALGVAVMILSSSIAVGFQSEIKNKVLGFGSHFQINQVFENNSFESVPMSIHQDWLIDLESDPDIKHLQKFIYKPGIIQSKNATDTTKDGIKIRDLTGLLFKGIGNDFDRTFIESNLLEGTLPYFESSKNGINDSILISSHTAKKLKLKCNDAVSCFFVSKNGPQQRLLIVSGLYETGLEDFDKQFAFLDINLLRNINLWGVSVFLELSDSCSFGVPVIEAKAYGGNGNYRYKWDNLDFQEKNKIPFCSLTDTVIRVIVTDVMPYSYSDVPETNALTDTAWLSISISEKTTCPCGSANESLNTSYLNDSVNEYTYKDTKITTILSTSGGSSAYYCGGFELQITDLKAIQAMKKTIYAYTGPEINVESIVDRYEEIFKWLEMLDLNVYIILSLMIIVATINMIAALLVIILERTRTIGILMALGASNWLIKKIFIYNGAFIILKGLLFGNAIAFLIIFVQNEFQIITLSQANYYVSIVPMYFPIKEILIINALSFVVCSIALLVPSSIVSKIRPIKAIKFE